MNTQRRIGAGRPVTLAAFLLMSSALIAPAFAEVETVVVTAQKRSEDIQTVPIAVTAFTSQDLAAHQIVKFSDLQFAVPNVSYSQANFGGANFQVRGIGITAVGAGAESGVAINFANVYMAAPGADTNTFYDLQDLEILRGPQSTLYGRGATGGVVNIAPNRPDLEEMSAQADATYGNYNAAEIKGDVNIPIITDQLGLRLSGDWVKRDGFTKNIADGSHQQDRDQYSVRGAVRWQPSDSTTIDFLAQSTHEDDARGRADKELCNPDPTGVLGCTPGKPMTGALNLNATYLNILASKQGYEGLLAPGIALQTLTNPTVVGIISGAGGGTPTSGELGLFLGQATGVIPSASGGNVPALLAALPPSAASTLITEAYQGTGPFTGQGYNAGFGLGYLVGLTDTSVPFVAPANSNPSNYRQVNDDFNPINKQQDDFMSLEIKQNLAPWLDAVLVAGMDHSSYFNQQSYTNTFGPALANPLPAGACSPFISTATDTLSCAEATFLFGVVGNPAFGGNNSLRSIYSQFFSQPGQLPVSNFTGLGISSGSVNHYSPNLSSYDEASGNANQYSGELRFNSKLEGPVNFMLGIYYLHQKVNTNYYVGSNSLDYASILAGGLGTLIDSAADPSVYGVLCYTTGCLDGPSYYHNEGRNVDLRSQAIFGEVYYDIVPDVLKLTLGGRYTDDQKSQDARIAVLSGLIPIGASNEDAVLASEAAACIIKDSSYLPPVCGFDPNTSPSSTTGLPFIHSEASYRKWTGRAVLDWTPTLDFTDKTLIYASYARGYKAGGFNPGVQGGIAGLPLSYQPEFIDAYELGTKNIALDGSLQANGDIWYYNYSGLQVSAIIDNTSINENISAKLWGAEAQFVWLPTDDLQFNLNLSATHSGVTKTSEVDERNPTGGDPRAILVKDNSLTSSANQNCVIYDLNPGHATPQLPIGYTLVPSAVGPQFAGYSAPPGGINALAANGVAAAAFGSCSTSPQLAAFLAAQGYSESDPGVPGSTYTGVPVSLNGNQMQQTPDMTISVGAQYTFHLDDNYTLVPRVDYYWQSHMWGRIFHDAADYIKAWDVMNAQVTLNAPDGNWYVGAWVKNVFDKTYVTGEYLTSSSSGLYTNAFLGDPRTYGVSAGVKF
jgi:outer membrane receptor protein involved in Fe transport